MLLVAALVFAWVSASLFFLAVCAAAKRGGSAPGGGAEG